MRRVLSVLGTIPLAVSCSEPKPMAQPPTSAPSAQHPHGHGHDHGHDGHGQGPMVHRFEHAEHWAPKFDDPARDAWQRPKDVVGAMGIEAGMTVADVGAGTGYFEPYLSRAVGASGTVLAHDVEPDMVRYIRDRATREQLTNVKPALSAMDDPKLPAEGVDRILIVDVWHHVGAREAYAAKLKAALKPGGKVFIVDFKLDAKEGPPPQHRLPPEAVMRELGGAGLTASLSPTTLPEQYIVVGTR